MRKAWVVALKGQAWTLCTCCLCCSQREGGLRRPRPLCPREHWLETASALASCPLCPLLCLRALLHHSAGPSSVQLWGTSADSFSVYPSYAVTLANVENTGLCGGAADTRYQWTPVRLASSLALLFLPPSPVPSLPPPSPQGASPALCMFCMRELLSLLLTFLVF